MSETWYSGPYRVLPEIDTLGKRPQIGQGDILAHASGAIILRCPKCGAMQFARAKILNDPQTPTLDRPIQCGSGHCKRCGIWFNIKNGRAAETKSPVPTGSGIPERLARAGVKPPPKL